MFLGLITLFGLVLRLVSSNQSIWLDEGASLMFAKLPLTDLFTAIKTDFHPPLFYVLLHFWQPYAGQTEWLVRLPFILIATLTIPAVYYLCREIFGVKSHVPWISALLLALNPLHIYYSQEIRMYSLATLLVVVSWLMLIKKKIYLTAFVNLLSLFTFYGCVFNFVSQLIYLIITRPKDFKKKILIVFTPSILLFLAWSPIFLVQLENGQYLKEILPKWSILSGSLTIKSLLLIPLKFILGRISFEPQPLYYLAGGLLTVLFLIIIIGTIKIKKTTPIWMALLTPLVLGIIISLKTPVLGYWRFLYILPFFLTLLAVGIESMPKIIFYATLFWACGVFIFSNIYFWTNIRFQREDWRGLSNFVSSQNALLVLPYPDIFAPLHFYNPQVTYLTAQDTLGENSLDLSRQINASDKNKIFVMDYLADLTDPNRQVLKTVRAIGLKEIKVYNFNNLGQLYEFQRL